MVTFRILAELCLSVISLERSLLLQTICPQKRTPIHLFNAYYIYVWSFIRFWHAFLSVSVSVSNTFLQGISPPEIDFPQKKKTLYVLILGSPLSAQKYETRYQFHGIKKFFFCFFCIWKFNFSWFYPVSLSPENFPWFCEPFIQFRIFFWWTSVT